MLDLIVCGTADAITMVEAGAEGRPGGRPHRGARARPPRPSAALRAQLELREQVGKAKWYDPAVKDELDRATATASTRAAEHGLAGIAAAENEILVAELPPVTGDASEDAMVRRTQVAVRRPR